MTFEDARYADGPRLMEWLDRKGVTPSHYGISFARRSTDWRKGAAADFYTVDKLLVAAGLFPFEVPDEVWREPPVTPEKRAAAARLARGTGNYSARKLSAEQVLEIRRRLRFAGATKKGLAREFGVSPDTIRHIANRWTWAHLEDEVAA